MTWQWVALLLGLFYAFVAMIVLTTYINRKSQPTQRHRERVAQVNADDLEN
jgi:phosphotransferase system  glucose/maltose/N-acetylglucosamine-specific IIC component